MMPLRTISVSCGLLKRRIGPVCHNRSSNKGLPRVMDFGNMKGQGGLAKSNTPTPHSEEARTRNLSVNDAERRWSTKSASQAGSLQINDQSITSLVSCGRMRNAIQSFRLDELIPREAVRWREWH